jgi:hypothetical protein
VTGACPVCGANTWDCEVVDVGVCNVPVTPYGCSTCHSFVGDDGAIVRGEHATLVLLVNGAWDYYHDASGNNAAGGWLHVVLDDGNLEDNNIRFCMRAAQEHSDAAGVALAIAILGASEEERSALWEARDLYRFGAPDPRR